MKKPPLATRATDSKESVPLQEEQQSHDALDLSPERISKGASTQTEVLTRILEPEQRTQQRFRHWGINE